MMRAKTRAQQLEKGWIMVGRHRAGPGPARSVMISNVWRSSPVSLCGRWFAWRTLERFRGLRRGRRGLFPRPSPGPTRDAADAERTTNRMKPTPRPTLKSEA